ncbi:MAG: DMT family transporter [Candidatus Acidiferrum sp.]
MGILLGLLTALSWGSSDFIARFAAHKIGALRTTFYMQLAGFFLLSLSLPWIGGWGHLFDGSGWHPWAWGALAGLLNGIATLALYRSFELGKLAIVAPLSASYPALTLALSLFTGEHLTAARITGSVLIVAGVAFVAGGEKTSAESSARSSGAERGIIATTPSATAKSGIGWALLAATGFGFLFWLLGTRIIPAVGYGATVWMIRLTSSILTALVILFLRQPISLRRSGPVPIWLVGMGALDTGAFVLSNYGMQIEQVSVVTVLTSLYGAVTVALAAIFLRERISRWQWLGIAAIFTGIVLISR